MRTRALALSTVAAMTAGALSVPTAGAVSYPSAGSVPVAQLDITQVDGGVAYVFATPELQSHIETVTRQLHELRAKAWDANLPFAGARLRDVAPDRTAYINGISWSRGLEHSAMQRAAEENYDFDHRRGDGEEPWTVKSGAFFAENLTTSPMERAIANWSTDGGSGSEWNQLIRSNGSYSDGAGYIYSLLNPANHYFAQAQVGSTTAGHYSEHAVSGAPERLEGRHAFPIVVPEAALASAAIRFSGGTHVGDSGSIGVSIAGWDGARLGVPGSSLTSSDPEVLAVHSDGTYEALQEGTAEVRITPYLLRNGETRPAGEALNQTVAVTKKPAISGSGGGSSAGAAIGIIAAIVAILGIGSQVLRQMGFWQ